MLDLSSPGAILAALRAGSALPDIERTVHSRANNFTGARPVNDPVPATAGMPARQLNDSPTSNEVPADVERSASNSGLAHPLILKRTAAGRDGDSSSESPSSMAPSRISLAAPLGMSSAPTELMARLGVIPVSHTVRSMREETPPPSRRSTIRDGRNGSRVPQRPGSRQPNSRSDDVVISASRVPTPDAGLTTIPLFPALQPQSPLTVSEIRATLGVIALGHKDLASPLVAPTVFG